MVAPYLFWVSIDTGSCQASAHLHAVLTDSLLQAKVEPPWADNCAMRIEKWGILVNALNKLAVRSAALEGLLEVTIFTHTYIWNCRWTSKRRSILRDIGLDIAAVRFIVGRAVLKTRPFVQRPRADCGNAVLFCLTPQLQLCQVTHIGLNLCMRMCTGGVAQGPEQVMSEEELRDLLGCDVVPLFKVLFAQMAASCVEMTEALRQSSRGRQVTSNTQLISCKNDGRQCRVQRESVNFQWQVQRRISAVHHSIQHLPLLAKMMHGIKKLQ